MLRRNICQVGEPSDNTSKARSLAQSVQSQKNPQANNRRLSNTSFWTDNRLDTVYNNSRMHSFNIYSFFCCSASS